jgi:hypothetical protein
MQRSRFHRGRLWHHKTYHNPSYTAAHIPGARFVGYPMGGHLLLGNLKEASSEVVAFLRKVFLDGVMEDVDHLPAPVDQKITSGLPVIHPVPRT